AADGRGAASNRRVGRLRAPLRRHRAYRRHHRRSRAGVAGGRENASRSLTVQQGQGAASHPVPSLETALFRRQAVSIALHTSQLARATLAAEGIELLTDGELRRMGRRALRVCLVNLMPNKIVTEMQIGRLLGATVVPVALTLCVPDSYRSKTTPAIHMARYYRPWSQIREEPFDGLIVTGAPVETLPFEDVTYWRELLAIFDWAKERIASSLYICWAAQAALHHF